MNEKLNSLKKKISELEDLEFDLEEELDEVKSELRDAQEEYEQTEMASIDLSDSVDVHLSRAGKLEVTAYPAKIVGDLAIIKINGDWQVCSVFKGRKVRNCQTLETALLLIEQLQQFNWSFAKEEILFTPKEIIDFISTWENHREAIAL